MFFLFKKIEKNLKNQIRKKVLLDILETRLVSKFGVIRLKITPFSKEKRHF